MKLLQHFKELTIRPKNAHELKGLILQLAIQGKLTANWREENPLFNDSNELLLNIKEYNSAQLKLNKRRVNIPKGDLKELNYLPKGWVKVANYDLFNLQKGRNPKDLSETKKKYPYHDIESLDRGNVRRYSNDEKAPKCKETDILVVCDGSRSGLILDGKPGIVGSTLAIIHTPPFIKDYIKLIFLQDFERANANMIGAAIPHLNTKGLLRTTIGLPPLEEQKEIVKVVETLFKEVEQLEQLTVERISLKEDFVNSALNQLTINNTNQEWAFLQDLFKSFFNETRNIKKLRETVLQLAVQGKLTANWRANNPDTEDASQLLIRIQKEKAQLIKDKIIRKEKPLPKITKEEIPYKLPEGWVWCRVGDLTTIKGGKRIPKGYQLSDTETEHVYIRVTDMKNGTIISSKLKYITDDIFEIIKNYTISKDDLYITIAGTIGDVGVIPEEFDNMNLTENAAKLIIYQIDKIYLKTLLRSHICQYQFLSKVNQMAQPKLALHRVASTIIPLPPAEEQKAIVQKVNTLMGLCDSLEQEVQQNQEHSEQLMQSCLREVFEGKIRVN